MATTYIYITSIIKFLSMNRIIEMGKEGKIFSLEDVADLLYGGVESRTLDINWEKKDISRKFLWRAHNFSSISEEDRHLLVKYLIDL